MSDAAIRVDPTSKSKAPKNVTSPSVPKFEMPKFGPAAIRNLAKKGGAQAKENYEKMKAATEEMTNMVEATYVTSSKGATDYGLKVINITRVNTSAAFDFIGKLAAVKSLRSAFARWETCHLIKVERVTSWQR
ncbi:MAG: phasin family protein [Candidatus Acidiferrales bacterium]